MTLLPEPDAAAQTGPQRAIADRSPEGSRPTIATVLAKPRFAFLVVGQTISQLGDKLHHMALISLVGAGAATNTGGLELAKLSVVFTAPVVFFGPFAGALVDRWNKRATMIACDALRAILVGLIPWLYASTGRLWPVYVVAFLVFLLGTFFNSAKMALIPELVTFEQLLPANAALTFIGRFATVIGIVGGGVIIGMSRWRTIGWSDYAAGFYLDSASYLLSVLTLLGIVVSQRAAGALPHPGRASVSSPDVSAGSPDALASSPAASSRRVKRSLGSLVGDVRETVRVVRHHAGLRFVFSSLVLLALFASTVYVAMTYSVQSVMGKGAKGVGYLGGLLAAGTVVGSLVVGTLGSRWDKRQTIMIGTAGIGLMMIVGGIFFSFAMFAPVAFVGGALLAPVMVSQDTLLHEYAPTTARGLIFSTKDLIVGAVFMLAALAVGGGIFLLGRLGLDEPYRLALLGVGALISAAGVAGELSLLRRAR